MTTLTLTKQRLIPAPLIMAGDMGGQFHLVPNGGWYTVHRTRDNKALCEVSADSENGEWLWTPLLSYRPSRWSEAVDIAHYIYTHQEQLDFHPTTHLAHWRHENEHEN